MNEQELRALVRQAVAFHLQGSRGTHAPSAPPVAPLPSASSVHISHGLFMLPAEPGGACVIEPQVGCNHCGFCKSYGH